jgi:SAM-dependent methyltransferase
MIPNSNRYEPVEDAMARSELTRLNEVAHSRGWRAAVGEIYADNAAMVRYVTDNARARFLDLLPLTKTSRVLEIGPGLGQFTCLIADRAGSVDALEVVEQQAQFVAERCRQSQIANVTVACGGDDCRLPYADRSFDTVLLNLVLEWCGSRDPSGEQQVLQQRLLTEIHRVLKPGGSVFLATKNRFALRYLLGGPDEHMHDTRFGSALPRLLGRLLLAILGLPRAPGRLYSWRQLRRLLERSGLEVVKSYWAAPEMRYPARWIDTCSNSIRAARREGGFAQGETRKTALLMRFLPAAAVKYVMPGLVFLARRPAERSRSS